jgi:hypothetical protein
LEHSSTTAKRLSTSDRSSWKLADLNQTAHASPLTTPQLKALPTAAPKSGVQRQWTCGFGGSKTGRPRNNSLSAGVRAPTTWLTTSPSTTHPPITLPSIPLTSSQATVKRSLYIFFLPTAAFAQPALAHPYDCRGVLIRDSGLTSHGSRVQSSCSQYSSLSAS